MKSLLKLFKQAREAGFSALYVYSKIKINSQVDDLDDRIYFKTYNDYWSPKQLDQHLDMFDTDHLHQTLIALNLDGDFDRQVRKSVISPENFSNWSELAGTPINGVQGKALFQTALKRQNSLPTAERRFSKVWENPNPEQLPPRAKQPRFRLEAVK